MTEKKMVEIFGIPATPEERIAPILRVPEMRSQQEVYNELWDIYGMWYYEVKIPGTVIEILRHRITALEWVLNLSHQSNSVETLVLTKEEIKLLKTLLP